MKQLAADYQELAARTARTARNDMLYKATELDGAYLWRARLMQQDAAYFARQARNLMGIEE